MARMNDELLRLLAHVDQARSGVREALDELSGDDMAYIIKTCAAGNLTAFNERIALLVGMLATVAIFDLLECGEEG